MIDWTGLAQELNYAGEKEMWEDLYLTRKMSVSVLAAKFGVGQNTLTQRLKLHVQMRKRGGPQYIRIRAEDVAGLISRVESEGIKAVAASFDPPLHPTTLYKRLFYSKGQRRRSPQQSASPSVSESTDPPKEDVPGGNQ